MDERTYDYMKERVERYEGFEEKIKNLDNLLNRIDKYPNSIQSINIQGCPFNIPKDFESVLIEYVHKKIEELKNIMGEI